MNATGKYFRWLEKKSSQFISKEQIKCSALDIVMKRFKDNLPALLVFANKDTFRKVRANAYLRFVRRNVFDSNGIYVYSSIIDKRLCGDGHKLVFYTFRCIAKNKKVETSNDIIMKMDIHPIKSYKHYGVNKIISGGQSGADLAGLRAGRFMKMYTGGTAPAGYLTENGSNFDLKDYGLNQHKSPSYQPRTAKNIKDADMTIVFGNLNSPGSLLTCDLCVKYNKPSYLVEKIDIEKHKDKLLKFIVENNAKIINIAGNRESVNKGIEKKVFMFLVELLSRSTGTIAKAKKFMDNGFIEIENENEH